MNKAMNLTIEIAFQTKKPVHPNVAHVIQHFFRELEHKVEAHYQVLQETYKDVPDAWFLTTIADNDSTEGDPKGSDIANSVVKVIKDCVNDVIRDTVHDEIMEIVGEPNNSDLDAGHALVQFIQKATNEQLLKSMRENAARFERSMRNAD